MNRRSSFQYSRVFSLFLFLIFLSVGCRRSSEEHPVVPPSTHPLARDNIGYGVVNISFAHLLNEPGPNGVSQGHIRRGTVVRIIERRSVIIRDNAETWVFAEGNNLDSVVAQGWLQEVALEIFDNESRARTASEAFGL
jgi:hypothetical protein